MVYDYILSSMAETLKTNPEWLKKIIAFESNWNPYARNPISGARGLIQFTNTTARRLGYESADDLVFANPTASLQLTGPVLNYLSQYKPLSSEQALYMAVFYPDAMYWSKNDKFPEEIIENNHGIETPGQYIERVNRHYENWKTKPFIFALIIAGLLVGAKFLITGV